MNAASAMHQTSAVAEEETGRDQLRPAHRSMSTDWPGSRHPEMAAITSGCLSASIDSPNPGRQARCLASRGLRGKLGLLDFPPSASPCSSAPWPDTKEKKLASAKLPLPVDWAAFPRLVGTGLGRGNFVQGGRVGWRSSRGLAPMTGVGSSIMPPNPFRTVRRRGKLNRVRCCFSCDMSPAGGLVPLPILVNEPFAPLSCCCTLLISGYDSWQSQTRLRSEEGRVIYTCMLVICGLAIDLWVADRSGDLCSWRTNATAASYLQKKILQQRRSMCVESRTVLSFRGERVHVHVNLGGQPGRNSPPAFLCSFSKTPGGIQTIIPAK